LKGTWNDLLRKKQEGKPIERPERREPAKVVNLIDALRKSVEASGGKTTASKQRETAKPRRTSESSRPKRAKRAS
jgi:DNA end-binding protein Ku